MSSSQLISVIVPVYNVERKLPLCLDSILRQTYCNLEILMIDDGSTDGSSVVCNGYCAKDVRCRLIRQEHRGVSEARNTGLRHATGTYIAFIDSDDWIHPQYFEYLWRAINEGDYSLSMALGVLSHLEDVGHVSAELPYSTEVVKYDMLQAGLFSKKMSRRLGSEIPYGVVWGRLCRKELLDGLYFKDTMHEDTEYSNRIFNRGGDGQAIVVPQRMYYWIQHPDSLHHSIPPQVEQLKIDCYLLSLNEIPQTNQYARGYCLDKLFKAINYCLWVYEKYDTHRPFRDEVQKKAKSAFETHKAEFIRNRHLSLINKAGLLICYYIPAVYSLVMWSFDARAKLRKRVRA